MQQIEKIIKLGVKVDFNQGLDARLITDEIARLLAKVKWIKRIRFGCDTPGQIAEVERASALIDKYGYKGEYFLYCILMDFKESFARVNYWKSKSRRFLPHCQPFRDLNNPHQIIPQWQKDMAHWADRKEIYMSCDSKMFQDVIFKKATAMKFLRNRIRFFRPDGTRGDSPGCGSVLIAFGRENAEILRNCSLQGKYVELNNDK